LNIVREEREIRQRLFRTQQIMTMAKVGRAVLPQQLREVLKRGVGISSAKQEKAMRPSPRKQEAEKPVPVMTPIHIDYYSAKVKVCIDKAQHLLGYEPVFDLETGLALTERWARWANLL
jgi:nucleoside-diphosphate-sugar epimerase